MPLHDVHRFRFLAGSLLISADNMPQPLRIELPNIDSQLSPYSKEKDAKATAYSKLQINLCAESVSSMRVTFSSFQYFLTNKSSCPIILLL